MNPFLEMLTWVTFAITLVIAPVAWFRMVRAQTRAAYWKNIVWFIAPILLTFVFANMADLMPKVPTPPPTPPDAQDVFDRMPTGQKVLLVATAVVWIGGDNLLSHFHRRRLGKKWWQVLNPFDPPFKDFNTREWLFLGAILVVSLALGFLAISFGHAA